MADPTAGIPQGMEDHSGSDSEIPELVDVSDLPSDPPPITDSSNNDGVDFMQDVSSLTQGFSGSILVQDEPQSTAPVPLTILTGWLGAGKTTLLRRILSNFESKGQRVLVIQNEVSSLGGTVEEELKLEDKEGIPFGTMLELASGCVCCSVKSDFLSAIETMLKRRRFDYVILECSGLADPGPLVRALWVDSELQSSIYLDGIVCVVDGFHMPRHLDWFLKDTSASPDGTQTQTPEQAGSEKSQASSQEDDISQQGGSEGKSGGSNRSSDRSALEQRSRQIMHQLSFGDVIILNKCDLLDAEDKKAGMDKGTAEKRLLKMLHERVNPQAALLSTRFCECSLDRVLGVKGFDESGVELGMRLLRAQGEGDGEQHPHDNSITTSVITLSGSRTVSVEKVTRWLGSLTWTYDTYVSKSDRVTFDTAVISNGSKGKSTEEQGAGMQLFRYKGILRVEDEGKVRVAYLQGVHEMFDISPPQTHSDPNTLRTQLVFIGRNLDPKKLQSGAEACYDKES